MWWRGTGHLELGTEIGTGQFHLLVLNYHTTIRHDNIINYRLIKCKVDDSLSIAMTVINFRQTGVMNDRGLTPFWEVTFPVSEFAEISYLVFSQNSPSDDEARPRDT